MICYEIENINYGWDFSFDIAPLPRVNVYFSTRKIASMRRTTSTKLPMEYPITSVAWQRLYSLHCIQIDSLRYNNNLLSHRLIACYFTSFSFDYSRHGWENDKETIHLKENEIFCIK